MTNLRLRVGEENLNRAITWIKQLDQKVFALLAFQGVFLGFQVTKFDLVISTFTQNVSFIKGIVLVIYLIFIGLIISSLFFALQAIFPRVNCKHPSVLFFGSIAQMGLSDFRKQMKELDEQQYIKEIEEQVYTNSEISSQKHSHFSTAAKLFAVSFILGIISLFLIQLISR